MYSVYAVVYTGFPTGSAYGSKYLNFNLLHTAKNRHMSHPYTVCTMRDICLFYHLLYYILNA